MLLHGDYSVVLDHISVIKQYIKIRLYDHITVVTDPLEAVSAKDKESLIAQLIIVLNDVIVGLMVCAQRERERERHYYPKVLPTVYCSSAGPNQSGPHNVFYH